MGKNKGKHPNRRTPLAKWTSIMAKLDNEIRKEESERKKSADKKKKGKTNEAD